MKQNLLRQNYFVSWGVIVGVTTLIILSILILYIDFDVFRGSAFLKDTHLRIFLTVLAVIFSGVIVHVIVSVLALRLNDAYFNNFHLNKELGVFEESNTRINIPEKKYQHIVLLLHGFTASPQEFRKLIVKLEEAGIPYLAPIITGFGQNDTSLLKNARYEDWFRFGLNYYDMLSAVSEKVSIVGHSMGGLLATYVAQQRKVHRLILSAPGLYIPKRDMKYKRLLTTPVIYRLVTALIPYLPKPVRRGRKTISDTLKYDDGSLVFFYMAIPVRAIRELFLAQSKIDMTKIRNTKLLVLYGDHDNTVDMKTCLRKLAESDITLITRRLRKSAHNVFEDFDSDESCEYAIDFLSAEHIYATYEKWPD